MLDNMKRTIVFIMVVLLFSTSGLMAAESGQLVTLEDAVDLALEENIDLKLAKLNLEDARLNYKKSTLNNLLVNSKLLKLQNELQMVQAEENFKEISDNVILDIIGKYIGLVSSKQQLLTAVKELELEKRRVEEVKAQVEVGYKGSLELFEQETSYLSAANALEKIKDDLDQQKRVLRQKIAAADDIKFKLINLEKPEIWKVSEEDVLATAKSNNAVIEIRQKQVDLAKNDLEKAKVSGTPKLDLKKKEIALERSKLELTKEKENLEIQIQNKYFQYKQAVKNMNMAEKAVIQAEEHYKIIKEQNEAGLVSENDLLSSRLRLFKADNSYTNTIVNYYINKLQLQKVMGIQLEVDISNEESSK